MHPQVWFQNRRTKWRKKRLSATVIPKVYQRTWNTINTSEDSDENSNNDVIDNIIISNYVINSDVMKSDVINGDAINSDVNGSDVMTNDVINNDIIDKQPNDKLLVHPSQVARPILAHNDDVITGPDGTRVQLK